MGNAGQVIFFVLLFAASIIIGTAVLAFAARCVLVIVQETGLGQDDIQWPNEPMQDWLGHAVLFIELLGIWIAPAALAARILRHYWLPDDGALRVLILAGPGLWLFFPVGLLSSLSAQSRWVPFRWAIAQRMLRILPTTLAFYFLTAIVLSAAVVPWYYGLFVSGGGLLIPVAAIVGAAVLIIYSRLLGRFAWLIARLPGKQRAAPKAKTVETRKPAKATGKKKRKRRRDAEDPWAVPEEERAPVKDKRFPWNEEPPPKPKPAGGFTPPRAEEIEAYGIASDEPEPPPPKPAPRPRPMADEDEDDEPIAMQAAPEVMQSSHEIQSDLFAEQVRQRLAERTRVVPTPPAHPFISGVYTFPFYLQIVPNWIALSLGFVVEGFIVSALIGLGEAFVK